MTKRKIITVVPDNQMPSDALAEPIIACWTFLAGIYEFALVVSGFIYKKKN